MELDWTEVVRGHQESLQELGVEKVSCMAGTMAVWTGELGRLPDDTRGTRCHWLLDAIAKADGPNHRDKLITETPEVCRDWVEARIKTEPVPGQRQDQGVGDPQGAAAVRPASGG